jgi:sec-independent protein translocase protein TatB
MLDIGWTELLVIAIVLIVVVGPKDLPPMLRAFGKMTTNLRKMAGDFRTQFDQALREADMDDVRQTISDAQRFNPGNALREAINPLRDMGNEIRNDLQKATSMPPLSEIGNKPEQGDPLAEPAPEASAVPPTNAAAPAPLATPAPGVPAANAPAAVAIAAAPAPVAQAGDAAVLPKKPARAPRKAAVVTLAATDLPAPVPAARRSRAAKVLDAAAAAEPAANKKPIARTRKKPVTPMDDA